MQFTEKTGGKGPNRRLREYGAAEQVETHSTVVEAGMTGWSFSKPVTSIDGNKDSRPPCFMSPRASAWTEGGNGNRSRGKMKTAHIGSFVREKVVTGLSLFPA